jgi:hypothetical protein
MPSLDISPVVIPPKTGSSLVDHFSLLQGGPLYRFQRMIGMERPNRRQSIQRACLAVALTWLPLLILAAVQGEAYSGTVIPLLRDYATDVRYLIALPVLIASEAIVDEKLSRAVRYFVTSGLVDRSELPLYEATLIRASRLRDSWLPTVVLILLAFVPSLLFRGTELLDYKTSTWHTVTLPSGRILSLAGWWFATISVPIYRFLMYRWTWVIFMWAIFLRHVAKLRLNCVATHPDRAAGLGFLIETQRGFRLIAFAASAIVAGGLANQVAYQGRTLADLTFLMIGAVLIILGVMLAPLLVLAPRLHEFRRQALADYGALATTYVHDFDSKWIRGAARLSEPLLGTADLQSLADLSNSFDVVRETKYILITKDIVKELGLPILVPLVVLLLLATPTDKLVHAILKLLG